MNEFTIPMALVDFIPVIFFGVAAVILQRDLYNKMSKGLFAVFAAGTINIFFAGASKALYKLLYAAGICDFSSLEQIFMPTQSMGFLLAGISLIGMICRKKKKDTLLMAAVPPVFFKGTPVFIGFMCGGLGAIVFVLSKLSLRLKKPLAVAVFVLSFVCSLSMGYLSSRDFTEAAMNWLAQGINVVGQGSMLLGAYLLHKSGLASLEL